MRRFRFGLLVGFALGYWFGTKAGRERHRQLENLLHRAKESEAVAAAADRAKDLVETGVGKGKDLVETGVEKGKGLVDHVRSDDSDDSSDSDAERDTTDATGTVVVDTGAVNGSGDADGSTPSGRGKPAIGTPTGRNDAVNPGLPTPEIS
jgi:hypothetical protein